MNYPVTEVFRSLQGEGHFRSYPMTFVRLAGCSVLDCHIRKKCDEEPWKAKFQATEDELVERVRAEQEPGGESRVCITGGEPSDHDLCPLVAALRHAGYIIHAETSGVRRLEGIAIDWLTVSPKTQSYQQRHGNELKVVFLPQWQHDPWKHINLISEGTRFFHYYLQPLYVAGQPVNLDYLISLAKSRENTGRWAVSEQAHKSWGIK